MKQIISVLFITLAISACSTIPPEIEDRHLSAITESEQAAITKIEKKIIDKNREKQAAEKKFKLLSKLPPRTEEEIKLLKEENSLIKDQSYYYEKNKDAVNLQLKKTQLAQNESLIAKKTAQLQYQKEESNLLEAEINLRHAELALYIAELNNEKSKIAAAYRDRTEPVKPEKKGNFFTNLFSTNNPDDRYGYKKYSEDLETKKQDASEAGAEYSKAEKKFLDSKSALEKTRQ